MSTEIIYDCRWSDEVDEKFIEDFIVVENEVFKNGYTKGLFKKKYIDNIYGKSVVEVVYIDDVPSAARGLWRNDIDGRESYQPGDTCVTEACRGKGVFTEMTKRSVAMLPEDALVYNFPNQNSYPGYMKMGWHLVKKYDFAIFNKKNYFEEHPVKMDKQYAEWWVPTDNGLMYVKKGNDFFLVRKMSKPLCYRVVACVEREFAEIFQKAPFGIFFYRSEKKNFYNSKLGLPIHVVSKDENIEYIPIWKIDAL
ncbi:MAG: GNAT family N-acetyltransferase [Clostridia bacterium]|nr:GNAT family N-acetyltransferase [Clostridia bacterium]